VDAKILHILERLDTSAEVMANQASNIAQLAGGLKVNGIVFSGTKRIGAHGTATVRSSVNFASATVRATGGDVTISTSGESDSPPVEGPGVFLIPAGIESTVALAGNTLILNGTIGDLVQVTLWIRPQPPSSSVTHPQTCDALAPVRLPVTVATTLQLVAANPLRRGLEIFNENTAANIAYVLFGANASITKYTFQLPGGTLYEMPALRCYRGIVSLVVPAAAGFVMATELV